MDFCSLLMLSCAVMATSAWSIPFYPVARGPPSITRFARPPPHHRIPGPELAREPEDSQWQRPKRDHDDFDHDHDRSHGHDHDRSHGHDHDRSRGHSLGTSGVTGPVHTFVKTDKNANYKWGVRHHVGNKYAS